MYTYDKSSIGKQSVDTCFQDRPLPLRVGGKPPLLEDGSILGDLVVRSKDLRARKVTAQLPEGVDPASKEVQDYLKEVAALAALKAEFARVLVPQLTQDRATAQVRNYVCISSSTRFTCEFMVSQLQLNLRRSCTTCL